MSQTTSRPPRAGADVDRLPPAAAIAAGTLAVLTAGALIGVGAVSAPLPLLALAMLGLLTVLVVRRPELAAYIYLGLCPLIVGIDRGHVLPILRLNEALLGALWLGVLLGPGRSWAKRGFPPVRVLTVDKAVLSLAVFSSVTSLTWMYARGLEITLDDILYAVTLWKCLALYVLVRVVIRTGHQVKVASVVVIMTAVVVAAIGLLQAVGIGGVAERLVLFSSDEDPLAQVTNNRASSTIGGAIPFADVVLMAGALAWSTASFVRPARRWLLHGSALLLALASIASGQVSALVGLLVAVVAVGWVTRQLPRVLGGAALLGVVAFYLLQPVFAARFTQLDPATGLPPAWTGEHGRVANLTTHFLPQIAEGLNWLLGVRTSARVAASEPWREYVYIESGYVWLLWNGGVPLLISFVVLLVVGLRASRALVAAEDEFRIVGGATFTSLWVLGVLMVLDPHLTYRGTSDLIFPLVAMAASGYSQLKTRKDMSGSLPIPVPRPTSVVRSA